MNRFRHYFFICVATLSLILMPSAANAVEYNILSCDASGGVAGNTELFDANVGNGVDSGTGNCTFRGLHHIFSEVICTFVLNLNEVMGKVYCGIQFALKDTLRLVLTLYVAILGHQLLMGTAQLVARDVIIRFIKIAAVWVFATQSAAGIGIIFNFFMGFISEATQWIVNSLDFIQIDYGNGHVSTIGTATTDVTDPQGVGPLEHGDVTPLFGFMDALIYKVFNSPDGATSNPSTRVIGFFMAMAFVYFPMNWMASNWLYTTVMTLIRSLVSFLMCLAAIAFLIAMSPIFLSLSLFQSTVHFFDNWLRYIISYSLQVVIVFAIIVLWIVVMLKFFSFFTDLATLIFPYQPDKAIISGPVFDPTSTWGVCPLIYSDKTTKNADGTNRVEPAAKCPDGFDPTKNTDEGKNDAKKVQPPSKLISDGKFLYYVFFHLITLLIVTYAFNTMLQSANQIAQALSGAQTPPLIPSGFGAAGFGSAAGKTVPEMIKSSGAQAQAAAKAMSEQVTRRR